MNECPSYLSNVLKIIPLCISLSVCFKKSSILLHDPLLLWENEFENILYTHKKIIYFLEATITKGVYRISFLSQSLVGWKLTGWTPESRQFSTKISFFFYNLAGFWIVTYAWSLISRYIGSSDINHWRSRYTRYLCQRGCSTRNSRLFWHLLRWQQTQLPHHPFRPWGQ